MSMEENIDWLFDDPLPCVDTASCEPLLKTEVKYEAGCEEQLHDGTCVKAESTVKEEVQVKVEREDEASVVQCLCLSAPADCGACVPKCGRAEASSEGVHAGMEQEQYMLQWKRESETGVGGCGSLGLAEGKQCLEGGTVCEQEQAVDRAAHRERWQLMKVEGGDECGREEKGRRVVVQPLVSIEDCRVKLEPVCYGETGVQRLGEGQKVQVEGGVLVQASPESSLATSVRWSVCGTQWSDGSSASVASRSSPEVGEARPCVSSDETALLSHPRRRLCCPPWQQQCRKKTRVLSAAGDGHQGVSGVSSSHSNARRISGDSKKCVCSLCNYSCVLKNTLRKHMSTIHNVKKHACPHCPYRANQKCHLQAHIDTIHEGLKKYACPHCQYRAGYTSTLQTHIDTVHEGLKKFACPHCQYRAGQKSHLLTHIDTVHEGSKKHACPHCQYRAGVKSHLRTHIKLVHEGLKEYACPHCPYRAGRNDYLQAHIDAVHEGLKKYACPQCPYRAGHKSTLRTHIEAIHKGLKKHACPHCEYRACRKRYILSHIDRVHEGIKAVGMPTLPVQS